jgi:hypothetical protein
MSNPANNERVSNVIGKWSGLADAASAPRQTAATATATTAAAASAAPAASATAASATTTATRFLHAVLGRRSVLLVEDIERRQADVSDFFLAKRESVTQPNDRRIRRIAQHRNGFRHTLALRSMFHLSLLHTWKKMVRVQHLIVPRANAPCKAVASADLVDDFFILHSSS